MLTKRNRLAMGVTMSIVIVAMSPMTASSGAAMGPMSPTGASTDWVKIPAGVLLGATEGMGEQGAQFSMPFATISSGAAIFDNGGFGILGQTFVGTISNAQYTMEVGTVPFILAATTCFSSSTPTGDPITPDQGSGTKNRYCSFAAGDAGRQQAVRVTFTMMPAGYEYAQGRAMWVQEPFEVTEASCCNGPTPPPTYWAAELGCIPFYTDWSGYGTIDVYDDGLIPVGVYDVQVIEVDCSTGEEDNYSATLSVALSAIGDLVGDCGVTPCTPPQGVVDFVDISAVVEKFRNLPSAPRKARADIINSDVLQPKPDRKVDFVDISYCVDAFRNLAVPHPGPPQNDPCAP